VRGRFVDGRACAESGADGGDADKLTGKPPQDLHRRSQVSKLGHFRGVVDERLRRAWTQAAWGAKIAGLSDNIQVWRRGAPGEASAAAV